MSENPEESGDPEARPRQTEWRARRRAEKELCETRGVTSSQATTAGQPGQMRGGLMRGARTWQSDLEQVSARVRMMASWMCAEGLDPDDHAQEALVRLAAKLIKGKHASSLLGLAREVLRDVRAEFLQARKREQHLRVDYSIVARTIAAEVVGFLGDTRLTREASQVTRVVARPRQGCLVQDMILKQFFERGTIDYDEVSSEHGVSRNRVIKAGARLASRIRKTWTKPKQNPSSPTA